ncbi:MAG: hypothetical protein EBR01_01460 [Proteobacteria bacterium]|jgi:hypothetical protein|nr:hypothetical protein [Pseudomonadota bacterium]NBY21178.1 hypothetical protein [bacterium]
MGHLLKNRRGQAIVEWVLLMAASSFIAFLMLAGPVANFTSDLLNKVRVYTSNIVLLGESTDKAPPPTDPKRFKPVHL